MNAAILSLSLALALAFLAAPASAGAHLPATLGFDNRLSTALPTFAPHLAAAQEREAQVSKRVQKPRAVCAAHTLKSGASLLAGGWSGCVSGRLSITERHIKGIDYGYNTMDAAAYAMIEDPRSAMRAPLSASAGMRVPMGGRAHLGVEYSYSAAADVSPFHFRSNGGPADEVSGHSATVRLGFAL